MYYLQMGMQHKVSDSLTSILCSGVDLNMLFKDRIPIVYKMKYTYVCNHIHQLTLSLALSAKHQERKIHEQYKTAYNGWL